MKTHFKKREIHPEFSFRPSISASSKYFVQVDIKSRLYLQTSDVRLNGSTCLVLLLRQAKRYQMTSHSAYCEMIERTRRVSITFHFSARLASYFLCLRSKMTLLFSQRYHLASDSHYNHHHLFEIGRLRRDQNRG